MSEDKSLPAEADNDNSKPIEETSSSFTMSSDELASALKAFGIDEETIKNAVQGIAAGKASGASLTKNDIKVRDVKGNYNHPVINIFPAAPQNVPHASYVARQARRSLRPDSVSHEYYNLFVGCALDLDAETFDISRDRCITEYTAKEYVEKFHELTKEDVSELKTFPSLFTEESIIQGGKVDPGQKLYLGFIDAIFVGPDNPRRSSVKIAWHPEYELPRSILYDYQVELGVDLYGLYGELTRTHWAVKEIDLIKTLQEWVGLEVH